MALRAILGGTFDPVHVGHLHAARAVRRELGLDSVTLVLSARPPHRSATASAEDRWRMLELAAAGDAGIETSDLELQRRGPSYSIDTIEAFRARGETVVWILGSDGLDAFRTWHRYEAFAAACHLAVMARPPAAVTNPSRVRGSGRCRRAGPAGRGVAVPHADADARCLGDPRPGVESPAGTTPPDCLRRPCGTILGSVVCTVVDQQTDPWLPPSCAT